VKLTPDRFQVRSRPRQGSLGVGAPGPGPVAHPPLHLGHHAGRHRLFVGVDSELRYDARQLAGDAEVRRRPGFRRRLLPQAAVDSEQVATSELSGHLLAGPAQDSCQLLIARMLGRQAVGGNPGADGDVKLAAGHIASAGGPVVGLQSLPGAAVGLLQVHVPRPELFDVRALLQKRGQEQHESEKRRDGAQGPPAGRGRQRRAPHLEREAGKGDLVSRLHGPLAHGLTVDRRAVDAAQIAHHPAFGPPLQTRVDVRDLREGEHQIGLGIAADHRKLASEQEGPTRQAAASAAAQPGWVWPARRSAPHEPPGAGPRHRSGAAASPAGRRHRSRWRCPDPRSTRHGFPRRDGRDGGSVSHRPDTAGSRPGGR
jgi:hypothetical protein